MLKSCGIMHDACAALLTLQPLQQCMFECLPIAGLWNRCGAAQSQEESTALALQLSQAEKTMQELQDRLEVSTTKIQQLQRVSTQSGSDSSDQPLCQ